MRRTTLRSVLLVALVASNAFAQDPPIPPPLVEAQAPPAAPPPSTKPDTTYGRLDGDVALVLAVGATVGPDSPRPTIDFRVRYLETAGLFFDYEDGTLFGEHGADPLRVLAGGLELRPLFLGRWLTGREFAKPRLDLALDSLGIELGAVLVQPIGTSLTQRPGFQAGLGFELPFAQDASGLWLGFHGGVRWSDRVLSGGDVVDPADRALFLSITFAWHQIVGVHLVDMGDRARR